MKARIEVPDHVHGHTQSALIAAQRTAINQLLTAGGTGSHTPDTDRGVHIYEFDGPHDTVREVIATFMAAIQADGT